VVASDQHLGYENSNADDFKNFLDYILTKRNDIQSFILLGDLVDMWRRDASGIFLEFSWMVNQLLNIRNSKRIEIYIVAGNHDYHLLKLHGSSYLFKFYPKLPDSLSPSTAATQNNTINPLSQVINNKYIFKHGWEFDSAQHPIIMDWMCHNMSSDNGHVESNIYNILQTLRGRLDVELRELIDYHNQRGGYVKNLLLPPEERLKSFISEVEKKAYSTVNDGQVLVFGHTHRPFISSDLKLVNCGSWVKDAKINNTFVEIDGDDINIFQFKDKDRDPENITRSLTWNFNTH
jgi:UDP-2,3-diacylglucosamine pyrophosphatase LpxH